MPGGSFTAPTRYARMQLISGASGRLTINTLRPFGSVRSITWLVRLTCCACAGTNQATPSG